MMMMTTLHQPEPNGAHGAGPALTVSEATKALGGQVSRSTIERAINTRALPARRGRTPAGKPCVLVERDDLMQWYARREGAAAAGDDDDDVLTAPRAAADDDDAALRSDAVRWPKDVAQERLGELLRGVQAQGIAEVGRQVQPLVDRLVSAEARAARAEAERDEAILQAKVERTRRYELEQRRPWWRFW